MCRHGVWSSAIRKLNLEKAVTLNCHIELIAGLLKRSLFEIRSGAPGFTPHSHLNTSRRHGTFNVFLP